jgi:glycosyltransferase involved in cell wall biosynthesis
MSRPANDDDALHRALIPPVEGGPERPLWSVMIPTYNCAGYLEQTLRSVLDQDPGPGTMQIEVVDDCSRKDDPAAIVEALGRGRVGFHRQPENLGVVGNLNACLVRSRGRLVHLLHGDDFVLSGFYDAMTRIFREQPGLGAAFCRHVYVDADGRRVDVAPPEPPRSGVLVDAMRFLGAEQRVMTPAIVVPRRVYQAIGGFDRRLLCAEDWEMWMRIASRFPVYYEQEPLACYRLHDDSNTGRNVRSGRDLEHTRRAIHLFARYAPPPVGREIRRTASRTYAASALASAQRQARRGDPEAMRAQLRVAWRLRKSPRVLAGIAWTLAGAARRR